MIVEVESVWTKIFHAHKVVVVGWARIQLITSFHALLPVEESAVILMVKIQVEDAAIKSASEPSTRRLVSVPPSTSNASTVIRFHAALYTLNPVGNWTMIVPVEISHVFVSVIVIASKTVTQEAVPHAIVLTDINLSDVVIETFARAVKRWYENNAQTNKNSKVKI